MLEMEVIGNLGKDCTVNNVNGKNVINFSVADSKKDKNGEIKTTWIDCAYWSEKTGVAPYLKKGTKIFAKGEPSIRSYTKADGSAGVSFQLSVFKIELLSVAGDGVAPQQQQARRTEAIAVDENPDLPF
jgi:single-strand DNA-binding protein